MADIVQTPHADAGSISMQRASQASLIQRMWRAKRYYLYLVPIFVLLGVFYRTAFLITLVPAIVIILTWLYIYHGLLLLPASDGALLFLHKL